MHHPRAPETRSPSVEALRARLAECELELMELHHRVLNGLQLVASFLQLQQRAAADGTERAALAEAARRVEAIGFLQHRLMGSEEADVDLTTFLPLLVEQVAQGSGLDCRLRTCPCILPRRLAQDLAIILNELAINACKHGYAGRPGGVMHIVCSANAGLLEVEVRDEGVGFDVGRHPFAPPAQAPAAGAPQGGLGMTIISLLVRRMGASIVAEGDQGSRFILSVPLSARPNSRRYSASETP